MKLPQTIKIQHIFHILLLELCDRTHKHIALFLLPISVKSKDEYKIEKTFNNRNYDDKLQYFFK